MVDLVTDFVTWMEGLPPLWIYVTILAVSFVENVVPPIPGDILIVFAGYLVGMGVISFVPLIAAATVGGTLGFMVMYQLGRSVGAAVFDVDRMTWVPKKPAARVRVWLLRYGFAVVAANRFLSGARSVISLAVGAVRMRPGPVAGWAAFSAALWFVVVAALGYVVGDQWAVVGEYLRFYGEWVLGILVLLFVVYLGWRLYQNWRVRRESRRRRSHEDPASGARGAPEH